MEDLYNSLDSKKKQAILNWQQKGSLGVTAEDYELIGATPEEKLIQNPGKTLGEIMTDTEIREFISQTKVNIAENEVVEKMKSHNQDLKANLEVTLKYLESINRSSVVE